MKKGFLTLVLVSFCHSYYAQIDSLALDEVIVIGNIPVTQEKISANQITETNLAQDVPVLLQQSTSAVSTSDAGNGIGYTGIRIRGTDASRILVSLDEVPVNDSESQSVFWVNMPNIATSLESIEIQRGVGSSSNGIASFGASINLNSKEFSEERKINFETTFGSFNTRKASFSTESGDLLDKKLNFTLGFSKLDSEGYIDRATSDLLSYQAKIQYKANENNIFQLNYLAGKEKTYQSWYGIDKETLQTDRTFNYAGAIYDENYSVLGYYDNQVDDYKQDHLHLKWKKKFRHNWNLNTTAHYTFGSGFYEEFKQDRTLQDYKIDEIGTSDLVRQKWLKNNFFGITSTLQKKINLDFRILYNLSANHYVGNHFGKVINSEFYELTQDIEYYRNKSHKTELSSFAKGIYQFNQFEIYGDVQVRNVNYQTETPVSGQTDIDDNPDFSKNYTFFNPKIGITFRNAKSKLYGFAGISNREPTRTDIIENSEIKPEQLIDFELGYAYNHKTLKFNTNLYYMSYKNQLVLSGNLDNVGNPIRENSGKSYRLGWENSWSVDFAKNVQFFGNFTLSDNQNVAYRFTDANNDLQTVDTSTIAFSPSLINSLGVSATFFKIVKVQMVNKYVSKQYLDNTNNVDLQLDSYSITDALISIKPDFNFAKNLLFSLQFNNIFDKEYESNGYVYDFLPYYYPQAGFNILVGLHATF